MESNKVKITYLGQDIDIIQYISESNNQFNARLEYIKKLETKNINWKESIRLSKIWYCIKYKSCRYSPEVYNKVMSL